MSWWSDFWVLLSHSTTPEDDKIQPKRSAEVMDVFSARKVSGTGAPEDIIIFSEFWVCFLHEVLEWANGVLLIGLHSSQKLLRN